MAKSGSSFVVPIGLIIYRLLLANTVLQPCFSTKVCGTSMSLNAGAIQNSVFPMVVTPEIVEKELSATLTRSSIGVIGASWRSAGTNGPINTLLPAS